MIRLFSIWPLLLAAIVASGTVVGGAYLKGRADGRAVVLEQIRTDRITILKDGKEVDDAVLGADDLGLCAMLGGCELPASPGGH